MSSPAVVVSPYVLVRTTVLPYWTPGPAQRRYRAAAVRFTDVECALRALAGPLADELSAAVPVVPAVIRPAVLLMRRDVFNVRALRPESRPEAEVLAQDSPRLARWLQLTDERDALVVEIALVTADSLADERAALAAVCAAEPLRRAVALSGPAVAHGLARAAVEGATPDSRARKAEPGVLRYALRATTKTSPWSWYAAVGWGRWDCGGADLASPDVRSTTLTNHTLVVWLVQAVMALPDVRRRTPHRVATQFSESAGHIEFRRDVLHGAERFVEVREQNVRIVRTRALDVVLCHVRAAGTGGLRPDRIVADLTALVPGPTPGDAAQQYVDRLLGQQVLVPVPPVDPQQRDPLPALAGWLAGHGLIEPARLLRAAAHETAAFAERPADERGAALARLERLWRDIFASVGRPLPDSGTVREDVVVTEPVRLDATIGSDIRHDLGPLVPLVELFDEAVVLRRLLRHRLVAMRGSGGRCRVGELVIDSVELRRAAARLRLDGTVSAGPDLPPDLAELAALRRRATALARSAPVHSGELVLPTESLSLLDALPTWMVHRPSSYSWFVQPTPQTSGVDWCVNAVSDGWGRWLSRFLDPLGPDLTAGVADGVTTVLAGAPTQLRPGFGFNANLHPLLGTDEIGDDRTRTGLSPDAIDAVHDPVSDTVYLEVAATGRRLDVLYLGFLLPSTLPDRWLPLCLDLGAAGSTVRHLAPREERRYCGHAVVHRPRLRHRRLVLSRRSWQMDPPAVRTLRAALRADDPVPTGAAAVLAADLGLPAAVFVSTAARSAPEEPELGRLYRASPRPQFVDLHSPLHLRCLEKLLARHATGVLIEEALPVPGTGPASGRAVELIVETYRRGTTSDADRA